MDVDWKVGFCEGHARVLENPLHYTYFYIESTPYNVGGARGLGARARARTRHGLEGRRGTSRSPRTGEYSPRTGERETLYTTSMHVEGA